MSSYLSCCSLPHTTYSWFRLSLAAASVHIASRAQSCGAEAVAEAVGATRTMGLRPLSCKPNLRVPGALGSRKTPTAPKMVHLKHRAATLSACGRIVTDVSKPLSRAPFGQLPRESKYLGRPDVCGRDACLAWQGAEAVWPVPRVLLHATV
jgi:hypothetical protein